MKVTNAPPPDIHAVEVGDGLQSEQYIIDPLAAVSEDSWAKVTGVISRRTDVAEADRIQLTVLTRFTQSLPSVFIPMAEAPIFTPVWWLAI